MTYAAMPCCRGGVPSTDARATRQTTTQIVCSLKKCFGDCAKVVRRLGSLANNKHKSGSAKSNNKSGLGDSANNNNSDAMPGEDDEKLRAQQERRPRRRIRRGELNIVEFLICSGVYLCSCPPRK